MEQTNIISQMKNDVKSQLIQSCSKYQYISKLEKISKYFQSDDWKNRKQRSLEDAHRYADIMLSQIASKYLIYDANCLIYGDSKMYSEMSQDEKDMLSKVESEKICVPVVKGRYMYQHIGSSVVVPIAEPVEGVPNNQENEVTTGVTQPMDSSPVEDTTSNDSGESIEKSVNSIEKGFKQPMTSVSTEDSTEPNNTVQEPSTIDQGVSTVEQGTDQTVDQGVNQATNDLNPKNW